MSDRIQAIECPSCGAPLDLPVDRSRSFRCDYCGESLEYARREDQTRQAPTVVIRTPSTRIRRPAYRPTARPDPKAGKKSVRRIGCVLFLVLLLGMIGALAAAGVFTFGGITLSDRLDPVRIYSFGLARMLKSDDGSGPDLVAVTRNSDETTRLVYIDFDAEVYRRWEGEPLGEGADTIYNPLIANDSVIVFSFKTTLQAYARQDGGLLWESSLSDEISNICQDCLKLLGNRVVALTADGVLSGHSIEGGELVWQVRLETVPRQLLDLDGQLGIPDEGADGFGISIFEPVEGTMVRRIVPQCPNEVFDDPQPLGLYDPLLVSEDKQHLYVPIVKFRPGCLQDWDPETWQMHWQAIVPEEAVDSLEISEVLLAERAIYTSDGHTIHEIGRQDGAYRPVASDEDYDLVPLLARDGVLVTLAERTRGTRQHLLHAYDTQGNSRIWAYEPVAQELNDGWSGSISSDGSWTVILDDDLILLEAFSDPAELVLTTLDPGNGSVIEQQTMDIGLDGASYWIHVLGWEGDSLYLSVNNKLFLVDWRTGSKLAVWPG